MIHRNTVAVVARACGAVAAALSALAPTAVAASPAPSIGAPGGAALGSRIVVTGQNWPAATLVSLTLCGNAALDGAVDCAVTDVAETGTSANGSLYTTFLLALAPPYPCPCVIRATTSTLDQVVTTPIAINGLATAPPTRKVVLLIRSVAISDAHIIGHGPLAALFGGAPSRAATFRITNTGEVALTRVVVTVRWGRGAAPAGFVAAPDVTNLDIGATRQLTVAVPFSSLSLGSYAVSVRADPLGTAVAEATVHTKVIPWGLVVSVLVAAALVVRSAMRRRRRGGIRLPTGGPVAHVAGWYVDPLDPVLLRLWDGAWTTKVMPTPGADQTVGTASTPGWYADPTSSGDLRLWDGSAWTDQTSSLERVGVDR